MYSMRFILLNQLLLLAMFASETVKIGTSKPVHSTTTTMSPSTTLATDNDKISTEAAVSQPAAITASTSVTLKISSATSEKPTTQDPEWPDFPPKKTFNKTTTTKPATSTIKPSTTTISSTEKDTNTTVEPQGPKGSTSIWPSKTNFCFCDLSKDTCDINCCCDPDCSAVAIKVFRCLLEKSNDFEEHEGRFEDFKFQHGLPSCEVNDGWLCVFKTYKPLVKQEANYYLTDTDRYYKWPNLLLESEDIKSREFYKFGDVLRIINIETKEIQNLEFPSSFESSVCRLQEPIYHLNRIQRTCLFESFEHLKEFQLSLLQLEEKYKIFQTPNIPDLIYNGKDFENFVGNITISKCFENAQTCTKYTNVNENSQTYKLFNLKVNILHNFTNIQEIIVDMWLENRKENEPNYWLSYEIEFFNRTSQEFNEAESKNSLEPAVISGPLGYLTGRPLIIAHYEPYNKSQTLSAKNRVLNYFATNHNGTHTLAVLNKDGGACKRSISTRELISYGINVAKYCKIKLQNDSLIEEEPSSTNFTEVCLNLQRRIHDQLLGHDVAIEDLSSYFVSRLGKPQNDSNKWLQLQVYNADFDSVMGQYLHETQTFVCRNVLLSLTYEFHVATLMVADVPLQNVIDHAALHLAERHDLEFSLNENLQVPVTMMVRFFNHYETAASAAFSFTNFKIILFIFLELVIFLHVKYFN